VADLHRGDIRQRRLHRFRQGADACRFGAMAPARSGS
jgi:hypothetical protein